MNELKRILSNKRRMLILILMPIVSIVLFLFDLISGDVKSGIRHMLDEAAEHRAVAEHVCRLTPEDALEAIEAIETIGEDENPESFFFHENLKKTAEHIIEYRTYLDTVSRQAEQMSSSSIFGKNKGSFTYRNIQKTAKDFERLRGIEAEFGNNRAVETFASFRTADFLYLAVMIIFVISFFEDRKNGLCSLVRSCPNGRGNLALSRIGILLGVSVVFTVLIYVSMLAVSFVLYGGADGLDRAVQSIAGFRTCTLRVNIAEWLLIYLGVKAACGMLIGLIFFVVLSFVSNVQLSWFISIAVLAVEYAAYTLIPAQFGLSIFKYVNLFSFVHPLEPLSKYVNMNLFSYPVGVLPLLFVLLCLLLVGLSIAVIAAQVKRHPNGRRNILSRLIVFVDRVLDFFRSRFPIFMMEGYKLLLLGGSVIFLAAGIYFGTRLSAVGYEYIEEDYIYSMYLREAQGEINADTEAYLVKAREQIALREDIAGQFEGSLIKLENEVEMHKSLAAERGITPWLLDQTALNNYLGEKIWGLPRWNAIVVLAFMLLTLAPIFAFEHQVGAVRILRSTPRGRARVFAAKYAVATVETLALWCAVYLREWLNISQRFSAILAAPVQNADALSAFPIVMSLGAFLTVLCILRLIGMLIAAMLIVYISSRVNSWEKAVMLGSALILIPGALLYFSQEWAGVISVVPFVSMTEVLVPFTGIGMKPVLAAVWLVLAVTLTALARRSWIGASSIKK